MSSIKRVRLRSGPRGYLGYSLKEWYDDLCSDNRTLIEDLLGHSVNLIAFQLLVGFMERIVPYWTSNRNVFQWAFLSLPLP